MVGVAAAQATKDPILLAGWAGLVAGALSMAAGEYVSVSSQADTETADLDMERRELAVNPEKERQELIGIYVDRGLSHDLATQVADALTAHDALGAHARDEIGISEMSRARPFQAAWASAAAFSVGALPPVTLAWFAPLESIALIVSAASLVLLAALGALAASLGGASLVRGAARVLFWGAVAMASTALVGRLFGTTVA